MVAYDPFERSSLQIASHSRVAQDNLGPDGPLGQFAHDFHGANAPSYQRAGLHILLIINGLCESERLAQGLRN